MSNYSSKSTGAQIDAAASIERDILRLKDLATRADLRFLAYLIGMAHDEAAAIVRGRRDQSEDASTLAHKTE